MKKLVALLILMIGSSSAQTTTGNRPQDSTDARALQATDINGILYATQYPGAERAVKFIGWLIWGINSVCVVVHELHAVHVNIFAAKLTRLVPSILVAIKRIGAQSNLISDTLCHGIVESANIEIRI